VSLFGLQYSVFLPIYANDILKGGARTLGLFDERGGGGRRTGRAAICGSYALPRSGSLDCRDFYYLRVGLIIFSLASVFWLCTALLFVVGFAATSQMAATNTLIQKPRAG